MERIKKFFECTIPVSNCNLRCSYCYVIQENRRDTRKALFVLSPKKIGEAFSKERVGGTALFNLCGFGETLIPKEVPEIIYYLLKQGHYVNVTNNGTMTEQLRKIVGFPSEYLHRLSFSFSFHYLELIDKKLLDTFISNVKMVKNSGCSILIQMNMADEYIPYLKTIKELCVREFGVLPQIALTRREYGYKYEILTDKSELEYVKYARTFQSPLFEFTYKNFNKKEKRFCYAGDWSYKVDLGTGELRSCNYSKPHQNIYKDLKEPIKKFPIGNCCMADYCVNSSHYLSLGTIPEYNTPTYVELREREGCYSVEMKNFLSHKLYENNQQYTKSQKLVINLWQGINEAIPYCKKCIKKMICYRLKR